MGCNNPGSKIPTPHLDLLAEGGMRFTDAHAPSSVCTPSRYALLTGRYCWRTPLQNSVLWPYDPPLIEPGRLTAAELLRRQGYRTACFGKWHLGWEWATLDGKPAHEGTAVGRLDRELREERERAGRFWPAHARGTGRLRFRHVLRRGRAKFSALYLVRAGPPRRGADGTQARRDVRMARRHETRLDARGDDPRFRAPRGQLHPIVRPRTVLPLLPAHVAPHAHRAQRAVHRPERLRALRRLRVRGGLGGGSGDGGPGASRNRRRHPADLHERQRPGVRPGRGRRKLRTRADSRPLQHGESARRQARHLGGRTSRPLPRPLAGRPRPPDQSATSLPSWAISWRPAPR